MVHFYKSVCGISQFRFYLVFIKLNMDTLALKRHDYFEIIEKPHTVFLLDLCNKKFENSMIFA